METPGWIMMRVLMNRFHGGTPEAFLKNMPQENVQMVLSQDIHVDDPTPALIQPQQIIEKIHYSWMPPAIEQFPGAMQDLLIQALPPQHSVGIQKMMKKSLYGPKLSLPIRIFLMNLLYKKLSPSAVLPVKFLPISNLSILADTTKSELVRIIDFLGIQDLAEAIRFIVDKKKLKSVYNWLTPLKQNYLKVCLHQKDKLPIPKLDLEHWDGNYEKLDMLLHRRGLIRFAKALSGQHPDLFWHIIHILDIGRGSILNKHYTKESIPGVTPALTQQLFGLLNFLKTKE